ncbi:hypothetical protein JTB14_030302 [Gonioctena quinquepunctata]|nr:hypothetical protein JTB14_030302 [Gonioctena quinquepunctata]
MRSKRGSDAEIYDIVSCLCHPASPTQSLLSPPSGGPRQLEQPCLRLGILPQWRTGSGQTRRGAPIPRCNTIAPMGCMALRCPGYLAASRGF